MLFVLGGGLPIHSRCAIASQPVESFGQPFDIQIVAERRQPLAVADELFPLSVVVLCTRFVISVYLSCFSTTIPCSCDGLPYSLAPSTVEVRRLCLRYYAAAKTPTALLPSLCSSHCAGITLDWLGIFFAP